MRVTFFWSNGFNQQMYDRWLVQFNATAELPASPQPFIYEHFKQAVLANMKGKISFQSWLEQSLVLPQRSSITRVTLFQAGHSLLGVPFYLPLRTLAAFLVKVNDRWCGQWPCGLTNGRCRDHGLARYTKTAKQHSPEEQQVLTFSARSKLEKAVAE